RHVLLEKAVEHKDVAKELVHAYELLVDGEKTSVTAMRFAHNVFKNKTFEDANGTKRFYRHIVNEATGKSGDDLVERVLTKIAIPAMVHHEINYFGDQLA